VAPGLSAIGQGGPFRFWADTTSPWKSSQEGERFVSSITSVGTPFLLGLPTSQPFPLMRVIKVRKSSAEGALQDGRPDGV
jgi:hypothetical protein